MGFNLSFDWFHIAKTYTIFRLADPDWIPREHINEIALLEPKGQDGPCVKPACGAGPDAPFPQGAYQSLMAREDIRIKRVPSALAYALATELEGRVQLDNIYFARSADPNAPKWQVFDRKDRYGDIDTDFKDVVLRFNPAGGLKFLAEHAMGFKPKFHFKDVEPPTAWRPYELGYAPTALAVSSPEKNWEVWGQQEGQDQGRRRRAADGPRPEPGRRARRRRAGRQAAKPKAGEDALLGHAWPGVIDKHIEHWATRPDAREYANDDIVYTRALDKHFGYPTPGDNDSTLACMVPVVRWHGFAINKAGMAELLAKAQAVVAQRPVNINKPGEVAGLHHGRDGPHRDHHPRRVHEEEQSGGHQQLGDRGRRSRAAGAKARRAAPVAAARASCSRQASGGRPVQAHPRREDRRQGSRAVQEAAAGRQVPRQLRGDWHPLQPHGRGDGLNPQGIKHAKDVRQDVPLVLGGHDPLRRRLRLVRGDDRRRRVQRSGPAQGPDHQGTVPEVRRHRHRQEEPAALRRVRDAPA